MTPAMGRAHTYGPWRINSAAANHSHMGPAADPKDPPTNSTNFTAPNARHNQTRLLRHRIRLQHPHYPRYIARRFYDPSPSAARRASNGRNAFGHATRRFS